MQSFARVLALAFPCSALACSGSSSGGGPEPIPLVANHGLAAKALIGSGELRLVIASEEEQAQDLDGDGDTTDVVAHVLDLAAGTLTNTGFATLPNFRRDEVPPPEFLCSDALAVFVASELLTGRDLNGNGTSDDVSSWAFVHRTGELRELPVRQPLLLHGELAVFASGPEQELHVFDARDASSTPVGVPFGTVLFVRDDWVVFQVFESLAGDQNADGDAADAVLFTYDARTRVTVNRGWAVEFARWAGGHVGFFVREASQGNQDSNGDGDALDVLFLSLDPVSGRVHDPQLPGALPLEVFGEPEQFFLRVAEVFVGDRNGDLDLVDSILFVYDPRASKLLDTGLATRAAWITVQGDSAAVSVEEERQTGGGLALFDVLHVLDVQTGAAVSLGFESRLFVSGIDGHFLTWRDEAESDWNGDGDRGDDVLFDWSLRRRRLTNAGVVVGGIAGSAGETALVTLLEEFQGIDANEDGDRDDFVLSLYDARAHSLRGLGLAVVNGGQRLSPGGRAAALVAEQQQGLDLNGDGDLLDQVLHTIEL